MDFPRLDRLAQDFEHPAIPFGQFIEKEHAVMRQRDLAGTRVAATPDQRNARRGMVWRAIRPRSPFGFAERSGERSDRRRLQRVGFLERRQ